MNHPVASDKQLIRAGMFLGIGLGGFIDGILFHQLLQTHNMLSARLPKTSIANVEINMFWDGLFHVLTWTMTAIGVALLWRAGKHRELSLAGRTLTGALLLGWGLFNAVEGIIDHYILHIHHVMERLGPSGYDVAFVASGIVLSIAGWMAIAAERKHSSGDRHRALNT